MRLRAYVKTLTKHLTDDAVSDSAAQLAYYALFSIFAFLFFLVSLCAYLPLDQIVNTALSEVARVIPRQAFDVLQAHLRELLSQKRHRLLTLGLVTTLWSASRGVDALRTSLNMAYHVTESRPYWKTQLLALAMTVSGALLVVIALGVQLAGGRAGIWLAHHGHLHHEMLLVAARLRWPTTLGAMVLLVGAAYYFLPNVKQRLRFVLPGAVFAACGWAASVWALTQYGTRMSSFSVTYGSIGGVAMLLLWLYVSGLMLTVGGEISSTLEHLSRTGKAEGERTPGIPATSEDRPVSPAVAKSRKVAERWESNWDNVH